LLTDTHFLYWLINVIPGKSIQNGCNITFFLEKST
jgi:hypothetical protein